MTLAVSSGARRFQTLAVNYIERLKPIAYKERKRKKDERKWGKITILEKNLSVCALVISISAPMLSISALFLSAFRMKVISE